MYDMYDTAGITPIPFCNEFCYDSPNSVIVPVLLRQKVRLYVTALLATIQFGTIARGNYLDIICTNPPPRTSASKLLQHPHSIGGKGTQQYRHMLAYSQHKLSLLGLRQETRHHT